MDATSPFLYSLCDREFIIASTLGARVRARAMFVCGILFSWNDVRVARCRYYILSRIAFCLVRGFMRKGAKKSAQSKLCASECVAPRIDRCRYNAHLPAKMNEIKMDQNVQHE